MVYLWNGWAGLAQIWTESKLKHLRRKRLKKVPILYIQILRLGKVILTNGRVASQVREKMPIVLWDPYQPFSSKIISPFSPMEKHTVNASLKFYLLDDEKEKYQIKRLVFCFFQLICFVLFFSFYIHFVVYNLFVKYNILCLRSISTCPKCLNFLYRHFSLHFILFTT